MQVAKEHVVSCGRRGPRLAPLPGSRYAEPIATCEVIECAGESAGNYWFHP
jgi:hypothetical protein